MEPQYVCQNRSRVAEVRQQGALNGIDYLEVATEDQLQLQVVFVHDLPGSGAAAEVPAGSAKLAAHNFRIEGGVRISGIKVLDAQTAGHAVTLTVNARGDFSTYTLRLVASPTAETPPSGFDPRLAAVEFSFKAGCPSDFDCKAVDDCPPPRFAAPPINYLAKDYASFRRLMLDRLSVLMPDWRDRSPADPLVTTLEALAYVADRLSYAQDAVATEAYLATARQRASVRRHARLLDYRVHDGCNARTWVFVAVEGAADGAVIRAGYAALTGADGGSPLLKGSAALARALRENPVVFCTLHDVTLREAHNTIRLYTWKNQRCCLPRGATRATLLDENGLTLQPGDWLLFEEVLGPETGNPADADPAHRQVVRLRRAEKVIDPLDGTALVEVEWDSADALTFPVCVSTENLADVSLARGNLVLADHGAWVTGETLALDPVAADRPPRARLAQPDVTCAAPFDATRFEDEGEAQLLPPANRNTTSFLTATAAMRTAPDAALAVVELTADRELWRPQRDLLASDRFAPEFAVERAHDGTVMLRFGDNVRGRRPAADASFSARYRIGGGTAGNVGAGALRRIQADVDDGIVSVRNPLAARGGVDAETMEVVRQSAPQAFRRQERAVTTTDWAEVSGRHPEVQRATAQFRWTGSWHTVFITVDRRGGRGVEDDADFLGDFRAHLERHRLAGYDLEINGPVFVPLDLGIEVCVRPEYFRAHVQAALLEAFSTRERADGTRGFFHPDEFTFGQPVYLSRIYERAMAVPGVHWVEVTMLQRFGRTAAGEIAAGVLTIGALELAQCENDPNFPERGRITLVMEGGR